VVLGEIFGPDVLVVLLIALVFFGGQKLPKLARSLGQAQHEFRKGLTEGHEESAPESPAPETAPASVPDAETETVTMTRAELNQLIAEREAAARAESKPTEDSK
jgi:sec-independent protein translocase protein TatA